MLACRRQGSAAINGLNGELMHRTFNSSSWAQSIGAETGERRERVLQNFPTRVVFQDPYACCVSLNFEHKSAPLIQRTAGKLVERLKFPFRYPASGPFWAISSWNRCVLERKRPKTHENWGLLELILINIALSFMLSTLARFSERECSDVE
jgi:hypothetical protein